MSDERKTTLERVEELHSAVGSCLGVSPWQTIDQAAIDGFAKVTGDRQWIHVDPERAASGPFGTTIAHGFLTLSLCAPIIEQTLAVRGAGMQVNYGLEKVRFPAAVPAGASVRGTVDLADASEIPGGGVQAVLRIAIEVAGEAKPACVADAVVRYYP